MPKLTESTKGRPAQEDQEAPADIVPVTLSKKTEDDISQRAKEAKDFLTARKTAKKPGVKTDALPTKPAVAENPETYSYKDLEDQNKIDVEDFQQGNMSLKEFERRTSEFLAKLPNVASQDVVKKRKKLLGGIVKFSLKTTAETKIGKTNPSATPMEIPNVTKVVTVPEKNPVEGWNELVLEKQKITKSLNSDFLSDKEEERSKAEKLEICKKQIEQACKVLGKTPEEVREIEDGIDEMIGKELERFIESAFLDTPETRNRFAEAKLEKETNEIIAKKWESLSEADKKHFINKTNFVKKAIEEITYYTGNDKAERRGGIILNKAQLCALLEGGFQPENMGDATFFEKIGKKKSNEGYLMIPATEGKRVMPRMDFVQLAIDLGDAFVDISKEKANEEFDREMEKTKEKVRKEPVEQYVLNVYLNKLQQEIQAKQKPETPKKKSAETAPENKQEKYVAELRKKWAQAHDIDDKLKERKGVSFKTKIGKEILTSKEAKEILSKEIIILAKRLDQNFGKEITAMKKVNGWKGTEKKFQQYITGAVKRIMQNQGVVFEGDPTPAPKTPPQKTPEAPDFDPVSLLSEDFDDMTSLEGTSAPNNEPEPEDDNFEHAFDSLSVPELNEQEISPENLAEIKKIQEELEQLSIKKREVHRGLLWATDETLEPDSEEAKNEKREYAEIEDEEWKQREHLIAMLKMVSPSAIKAAESRAYLKADITESEYIDNNRRNEEYLFFAPKDQGKWEKEIRLCTAKLKEIVGDRADEFTNESLVKASSRNEFLVKAFLKDGGFTIDDIAKMEKSRILLIGPVRVKIGGQSIALNKFIEHIYSIGDQAQEYIFSKLHARWKQSRGVLQHYVQQEAEKLTGQN